MLRSVRSAGSVSTLAAALLASACARPGQPRLTASPDAGQPAPPTAVVSSTERSAARQRERPALMQCPWPNASSDTLNAEEPSQHPPGVIAPPRSRIPDCAPPGWTPPAELRPFAAPKLPADRPEPIVSEYLAYVVTTPPPELVQRFELDTSFYRKYADANGFPILGSAKVSDAALAIVRDQVNYMLGNRPDIRDTMIAHGARIVVMAETEYTMDIPEQRDWKVPKYLDPRLTSQERARYYEAGGLGSMTAEGYWNPRARGMGGTLTSCAEENVLGFYRTRYWGTNICVHEFSHSIMGSGIGNADPQWFQAIVDAYKHAKAECLRTADGYAGNTFNEYWATGVEWYVGNGGRQRAELRSTDSTLYELISRLIPESAHLPVRANVAARTRAQMDSLVETRNPEWWVRERQRQAEAARQDSTRRLAAGSDASRRSSRTTTPQCVPRSSRESGER